MASSPRPSGRVPVLLLGLVVLVVLLSGAVPLPSLVGASTNAVAPRAPSAPPVPSAARPHLAGLPSNPCTAGYPSYAFYGKANAVAPPLPALYYQTPCLLADPSATAGWHDEVHATYSSSTPGTGSRVEIPLVLPWDSSALDQASLYSDFSVGMVVSGDNSSVDNQSYVQVYFEPNSTTYTYTALATVWSLRLTSSATCDGLSFTWNNSYACEQELLGSSSPLLLSTGISGGHPVNVTFVGRPRSMTDPLTVYVNDSYDAINTSVTLNSTSTGGVLLAPAYNASCAVQCYLNWTQGAFGLGVEIGLCYGVCNSYSYSGAEYADPLTLLPPESWNGSAYASQYPTFATESVSGACQGVAPTQYACPVNAQTGYYPEFTFNGSQMNFGAPPNWSLSDFGGTGQQFQTSGTATDLNPEFIFSVENSSRGGFLLAGQSLNVTAQAGVFGNFSGLSLAYTLPNGATGNLTMSLVNGTSSYGGWKGSIPTTGGNGGIDYRLWATDRGGATIVSPARGSYVVERVSTLPTFTVALTTSPSTCGGVVLNGSSYTSGQTARILPGTYLLNATLCYPYVFGQWVAGKGAVVTGSAHATILITANTTLEGEWSYVRPYDTVELAFSNSICGTIVLNNTNYASSATPTAVSILDASSVTLTESGCAGYGFSGWLVQSAGAHPDPGNLTVLGSSLTVRGNGTITLTVVATSSAVVVTFLTVPGNCGGILYRGAGYTNDTQLWVPLSTPEAIHEDPCANYGFANFTTTGGVTVSAGHLTVTGTGTVTEENYLLTLVTLQTSPSWCGGINFDNILYTNGSLLNLTPNSYHSAYAVACTTPLYHFVGFAVSGGVTIIGNNVTVNSTGTLTANFQPGPPTTWLGFETNPSDCGGVLFEGKEYVDTNYTYVSPSTQYTISPVACPGFGFVGWFTTGGVAVTGHLAYVNSSGSVKAIFHPLDPVYLYTQPESCGEIVLDGTTYTNGATAQLPVEYTVSLAARSCAGYGFVSWQNTSDGLVGNGTVTILAATILTAIFAPLHYGVTVLVTPSDCGGVVVGNAEYFNGSTLALLAGHYFYRPEPCSGDYPTNLTLSGGLRLNPNATELSVSGAGVLAITYGPVPPSVTLSALPGSYTGYPVSFDAVVAVPVPPFNYSFLWNFGDGATQTTAGNSTSHEFAHTGVYRVAVTVHDPYGRVASANVSVTVTAPPAAVVTYNLSTFDWGIILGTILLVGLLVLVGRRRNRPPAEEEGPEGPVAAPPEESYDGPDFPKVEEPSAFSPDPPSSTSTSEQP